MKFLEKLRAAAIDFRAGAIALLVSLALAGLLVAPASALQVDQNRLFNARQTPDQQLSYYRITVNFNDQNIGSAQQFGALPPNSYIYAIDAYVNTAFNAATTNVITIGTTKANANELVASGISGAPLATGSLHLTSAVGLGTAVSMGGTWLNTNMPLFVKYAQTGTAATTGQIVIVIMYASNNDM